MFIVICHEKAHAICMKATSQTALYENNKDMMAGVVYYKAGENPFFGLNTAIQPDNLHPIPHSHLMKCDREGSLKLLGQMQPAFHEQLVAAVKASITLSEERRLNILSRI